MLLKFCLNNRNLILTNPEALVREPQISYIQCSIELHSSVFTAKDALIAVFKSASYHVVEECLLDVSYDIIDDEVVRTTCICNVPSKVFEHGGVIQLLIYKNKYSSHNPSVAQESTNTVEFFIDPRKYVPLRTNDLLLQLANDITELRVLLDDGFDYENLLHKPSIEDVTLIGNKTFPELNLDALTNMEIEILLSNAGGY